MSLFVLFVNAEQPPALGDHHLFYGTVTGLPSSSYVVKARVGAQEYRAAIVDGKYGYVSSLKVKGVNGATVKLFLSSGLDVKEVGSATYQDGAVTKLNLKYPVAVESGSTGETTSDTTTSNAIVGNVTENATSTNATNTTSGNVTSIKCSISWQCGSWSSCTNGQKTRTCSRSDACDIDLINGNATEIVAVAKPSLTQACTSPVSNQQPAVSKVCNPGMKQCSGVVIQQCAFDGSSWSNIQTCPNGCDSITLACKPAVVPVAKTEVSEKKKDEGIGLVPIIIGVVVVLLLIVVVVVHSKRAKKRLAPLLSYVAQARARRFNDQQIKTTLVSRGWDAKDVDKVLKK